MLPTWAILPGNGTSTADAQECASGRGVSRCDIEAGTYIALEDPLRCIPVAQDREAVRDGVRRGASEAKPIRVGVTRHFRNRVERKQVKCLHGSIRHDGNAKWALVCARAFRDVHASERLRVVAPLPQMLYCRCLLRGCVPGFPVNTRCSFAVVLRHSSNGNDFAAVGVGQEMLQSFDFAPFLGLSCLHDTRLESAHDAMGFGPVDGLPACRFVGSCTSNVWVGVSVPQWCCRHLLCLLDRLANLSRAERPDGSQLTFVWEDVALPIRLVTRRHLLFPSSSTRSPIGSPYNELSQVGELRAYHVSHLYHDGEGSACPPVTRCLRQESQKPLCRSRTFWFKPVSIFGLSTVTTFSSGSHLLARTIDPSPQPQ